MKRAIYLILLSIFTIGCIIFGTIYHTGKAMRHVERWWDEEVEGDDTSSSTEDAEFTLDPFTSIDVDADIASVNIVQGDEYKIEWSVHRSGVPSYDVKDGVLKVTQKHPHKNITGEHSCRITITMPENINLDRTEIDADVGDVKIKGVTSKKTTITADVGTVNLENCQMGDSSIEADVGDVRLYLCEFKDLTVSADVGSINIDAAQDLSDYSFDLEASVGDIHINNEHMRKRFEKHGSGKYKIDADCDVGSMEINFSKGNETL